MIVWPFMAQWCVCLGLKLNGCAVRPSVRPSVRVPLTPGMGFYVRVLGSMCVCPACFDSDIVHTGVCVIGLGYWNGQLNHT